MSIPPSAPPPSSRPATTDSDLAPEQTGEIVAEFIQIAAFRSAVRSLLAAGFERTDISVLSSHDSLDTAREPAPNGTRAPSSEIENVTVALESELPWLGPLAIAGVLLATTGPIGLGIAALVGAGAGAIALGPLLGEVTQSVHADDFAAAVEEGRILLWVRTADSAAVLRGEAILAEHGGTAPKRLAFVQREGDLS